MSQNTHDYGHFSEHENPWRFMLSKLPTLLIFSRLEAQRAYSYRDFKVGASVFSIIEGAPFWSIDSAGNTKNERRPKVCAEKKSLKRSSKMGMTKTLAVVVAATTDIDKIEEVTFLRTPTLHPCDECRGLFDEFPVARDDTLIISTGYENDVLQVHTHAELREAYNSGVTDLIGYRKRKGFNKSGLIRTFDSINGVQKTIPADRQMLDHEIAKVALLTHMQFVA